MESLQTPFERLDDERDLPHLGEVRRIASLRGRYNIPNIGIFLWRLRPHPLTRSPAMRVDDSRFLMHPLGGPVQLFNLPVTEDQAAHLAEPANVPGRITRRALKRTLNADELLDHHYGAGRSFLVWRGAVPVPRHELTACDLRDGGTSWSLGAPAGKVAVDPVLGRIAFNPAPALGTDVRVTYHHGRAGDLGGGEYPRGHTFEEHQALQVVGEGPNRHPDILTALGALGAAGGTIEIADSRVYRESLPPLHLRRFELRAAEGARPTLVLGRPLVITGPADARVAINGLIIAGPPVADPATPENPLRVTGPIERLALRHTTLVPGRSVDGAGSPLHPGAVSLEITEPGIAVEIDHSILGALRISAGGTLRIDDSIVDANAEDHAALCGPGGGPETPGPALRARNVTIIGRVRVEAMSLVENTIFLAEGSAAGPPVAVRRRQEGCVRFSYLPIGVQVPRRHQCQPPQDQDVDRVRPVLGSKRWNDPEYGQLSLRTPLAIRRGADDESEMGAFHDELAPLREAHLRARLDEYLKFGMEAGIFFVS